MLLKIIRKKREIFDFRPEREREGKELGPKIASRWILFVFEIVQQECEWEVSGLAGQDMLKNN